MLVVGVDQMMNDRPFQTVELAQLTARDHIGEFAAGVESSLELVVLENVDGIALDRAFAGLGG